MPGLVLNFLLMQTSFCLLELQMIRFQRLLCLLRPGMPALAALAKAPVRQELQHEA